MNSPFNESRYRELLEGLEAVEIRFCDLNSELRYEAEFFQKKYLIEDHAVYSHATAAIGSFAAVTDGPHGYHVVDENSPIAMLTAKCARDWFSEREGADTIADFVDKANSRSSLQENDIILSTRGTVGMCALVTRESLPANIDQDVARISWVDKVAFRPEYVIAYLNSRFGQDRINRYASGMVQQGLSLQKVRDIPIPSLNAEFQESIAALVQDALALRRASYDAMCRAEGIVLAELELSNWDPPEPLTYIRSSVDVFRSNRLDAEHFKPMFSELNDRMLAKGGSICLGDLLEINQRGKQPVYTESGIPVVNSKHVNHGNVALSSDNRKGANSIGGLIMKLGDVVLNGTGVGTIGRAAPYLHANEALPDNHVTILRPKVGAIDPVYLAVFLNSQAGQMQVTQRTRGSSGQVELYPFDIATFSIWLAPKKVQAKVRKAVEQSLSSKRQAACLLNAAQRAVEIAIEESESAALEFIANRDRGTI